MHRIPLAIAAGIVSAIVLLPIMLLGLVLRLIPLCVNRIARVLEPAYVQWTDLMTFDPVLGWRPRPRLDTHYLAERDDIYRIATDSEGWPGSSPLDDSEVVVIGDSFAFGYGAHTDRSFFALNDSLVVKAVGAPGYSMVHGVRLLEQLGTRLSGKLVVWLVYLENDLQDNLAPNLRHYRAPFLREVSGSSWEIASEHLSPEPWFCSQTNRNRLGVLAELCVPGPIADRAYSASAWLLARATALCRSAGASLAVVSLPHRIQLHAEGHARLASLSHAPETFDPTLPDCRLAAICDGLGVPFIAGRSEFHYSDYKRREGIHWNVRGHRKMAALLQRIYDASSTDTAGRPAGRIVPEVRATTA
jgi:hypothetical protein